MRTAGAPETLCLVCLTNDNALRSALESSLAGYDAVTLTFADPQAPADTLAAALKTADGVLCGDFPLSLLTLAPSLRWVQFWHAGVDRQLYPQLLRGEATIATASGIHAAACSEHILALMLAFARGMPMAYQAQVERRWARPQIAPTVFELEGKTVGIVGAGKIGQAIGKRCQAFGMRTVGTRRDPSRPTEGIDILLSHIQYHDLILESDMIVLALPLTASTRMLFGEDEIEILRKGTYLFNIGRGGLIDERWVIKALEKGWLAGAGLDVFADEPLPADSLFWSLPNCIVTPHVGGQTPLYWTRFAALVASQIDRLISGAPLENVVDRDLGY